MEAKNLQQRNSEHIQNLSFDYAKDRYPLSVYIKIFPKKSPI